jgi:hypothetical protein
MTKRKTSWDRAPVDRRIITDAIATKKPKAKADKVPPKIIGMETVKVQVIPHHPHPLAVAGPVVGGWQSEFQTLCGGAE